MAASSPETAIRWSHLRCRRISDPEAKWHDFSKHKPVSSFCLIVDRRLKWVHQLAERPFAFHKLWAYGTSPKSNVHMLSDGSRPQIYCSAAAFGGGRWRPVLPIRPMPEQQVGLLYPLHRHPSMIVRAYLDFCQKRSRIFLMPRFSEGHRILTSTVAATGVEQGFVCHGEPCCQGC